MSAFDRIVAVAHQIERERELAKPAVWRLRSTIGTMWDSDVPPAWRTAGFVMELSEAAAAILESNVGAARMLAQYAVVVATSIARDTYPPPIIASITADAWKELANAHRYGSEYDAALRAISAAEGCLAGAPAADWERTVVRFARAVVLSDMQRLDEASELAEEASAAFANYKEFRRSGHALLLKGIIAHRQSRFDTAAATFAHAVHVFEQTDDLQGLAAAYNNFGYSQAEKGEISSAVLALQKALSIFDGLELRGEAARTRCILASVLLRTGNAGHACNLFRSARETYLGLAMIEEAGLAGLGQADALLAVGAASDARIIVDSVVDEFRRASLNERAVDAVVYLQSMVATPRAREAVALVNEYVRGLSQMPQAIFLPLPE